VADISLRPVAGSGSERLLGEVLDEQGTVLVSESVRATMQAIDGPVVADALPRDLEVTVVEARIDDSATGATVSLDTAAQPEVWAYRDADWWRVLGRPDVVPGDSPTIVPLPPTTTTTPPSGDGGPVPVFLVCDRDDDEACAA
jgi:hypothetical protein